MLHITQASKTGKLEGINSINTSVLNNAFCNKMRKGNEVLKRTDLINKYFSEHDKPVNLSLLFKK